MYPNCEVKLSKTLVWVSGDTYPVKDHLKADGFHWSSKKKAWWKSRTDTIPADPVSGDQDHAIMGTASDGTHVVIAEYHHDRLADSFYAMNDGHNPWAD